MLAVHLRVNDAATGLPTPVRLCITGPTGEIYAPLGEPKEFPYGINEAVGAGLALGTDRWLTTSGSVEVKLPAGIPLHIRATKGPLYFPLSETITLGPGQLALRLQIRRAFPSLASWQQWDFRSHYFSPHEALHEAEAEGLDGVYVLACMRNIPGQDGKLYPLATNLKAYSAQTPALSHNDTVVYVGTHNTHPALGSLALLNTHRVVYPLTFGGEDADDWGVVDWCRQAKRKKGLVVWTNAFQQGQGLPGGEALVAALLGELDAVEWTPGANTAAFLPWYYRLWNAGFTLPLLASSGKENNKIPLGAARTFVPAGDYAGAIEAVRKGHTFISTGPLLEWTVNNQPATSPLNIQENQTVTHVVKAQSVIPFTAVEIVQDGNVVARGNATEAIGIHHAEVTFTVIPSASTWFAVRVVGTPNNAIPAFAHSNPLAVLVKEQPLPRRRAYLPLLRQCVEKTKEWAETVGQYTDTKWKTQLIQRCDEALAKLIASGE